jgi:hypothetical protein
MLRCLVDASDATESGLNLPVGVRLREPVVGNLEYMLANRAAETCADKTADESKKQEE